jgi:hypothetical protein
MRLSRLQVSSTGGYRFFLIALIVVFVPHEVFSQNLRAREDTAQILVLENVSVVDHSVSGEVVNRSPNNTLRDVQLFIRYTWLWDNETKPGKEDPGTSTYYTLSKEIAPGGRLPFTFKPSPPLGKVAGGRFETSVAIAGFTEVIPQTK